MVFCCIAIVGIAIIYFCLLWLRQLFTWPKREKRISNLPCAPRVLTGHGAMPVYGHTGLFMDKAGDIVHEFDPQQRQVKWFGPVFGLNRCLGECFAVFIWGQWRVGVKGPENIKRLLEAQKLEDSWPWTPPKTLLGQSCFGFLEEGERASLKRLVGRCLSHKQVQLYAPQFVEMSEKCLDGITMGQFKKNFKRRQRQLERKLQKHRKDLEKRGRGKGYESDRTSGMTSRGRSSSPTETRFYGQRRPPRSNQRCRSASPFRTSTLGGFDDGEMGAKNSNDLDMDHAEDDDDGDDDDENTYAKGLHGERMYKVKWSALRSYTLDLMDGPVLNLGQWNNEVEEGDIKSSFSSQSSTPAGTPQRKRNQEEVSENEHSKERKRRRRKGEMADRETMLLWMERIKNGLDVIKTTFGPEWMYIWILNEYGRALNARIHLEAIFKNHVSKIASIIPDIRHLEGHLHHDVTTQTFPILAVRENRLRETEGILGDVHVQPTFPTSSRQRSHSAPNMYYNTDSSDDEANGDMTEVSKGEDDLNLQASQLYRQQAEQYSTALRELDLVMPQKAQETEMTNIHSNKDYPLNSQRGAGRPDAASSAWKAHNLLRNQLVKIEQETTSARSSEFQTNGTDPSSLNDIENPRRPPNVEIERHSLPNMIRQQGAVGAPGALYQFRTDNDSVPGDLAIRSDEHLDNISEINESRSIVSQVASQDGGLLPHLSDDDQSHQRERIASTTSTLLMTNGEKQHVTNLENASTTSTIQLLEEMDNKTRTNSFDPYGDLNVKYMLEQQEAATPQQQEKRISKSEDAPVGSLPISRNSNQAMAQPIDFAQGTRPETRVVPVLERIMRQHDLGGNGVSHVVATELSLLIWMMMDIGNAWTAMALSLLSTDKEACSLVQDELDVLDLEFGRGKELYSPPALNRMKYLDALIYEAIRLCPANLGGMKKTTETVELKEAGVQIAKGTNVFFCQPTDLKFDIRGALGRKPENLGRRYPSVELHGFLPLHGLEVPIMVLQSKVFLIGVLQRFSPSLSMKKNFIRRVGAKVRHSLYSLRKSGENDTLDEVDYSMDISMRSSNQFGDGDAVYVHKQRSPPPDIEECASKADISQQEAMKMFTKTPFPEPRRVIYLRPRSLD